jgi:RNA polymerase sigma-70 factor (ECF subfamily)
MNSVSPPVNELTLLLRAWQSGDDSALQKLTPLVYAELHRLAGFQMAGERAGHLLQPSALVNEAFLRLMADQQVEWANRNQFFAVSARLMRQILIDFARSQAARKRGDGVARLPLDAISDFASPRPSIHPAQLVDLDHALNRLAELDPRQAKVVELRFFGGLENLEIAAVLGVSEPTVTRDWRVARAWLYNALQARC